MSSMLIFLLVFLANSLFITIFFPKIHTFFNLVLQIFIFSLIFEFNLMALPIFLPNYEEQLVFLKQFTVVRTEKKNHGSLHELQFWAVFHFKNKLWRDSLRCHKSGKWSGIFTVGLIWPGFGFLWVVVKTKQKKNR